MGKWVKIIELGPGSSIFIYGINKDNEMVFRTTKNMKHLQKEIVEFHNNVYYFGFYTIPVALLPEVPKI